MMIVVVSNEREYSVEDVHDYHDKMTLTAAVAAAIWEKNPCRVTLSGALKA